MRSYVNPWTHLSPEEATITRRTGTVLSGIGVVLMLLGVAAILASVAATMGTVIVLGLILVGSGIAMFVEAFSQRGWRNIMPSVLLGVLNSVVGLMLIARPGVGAASLTLLIATLFFIGGIVRMVSAITMRYPRWGLAVVSGVVSTVLGFIVFAQFPRSSLWLIGTLIGVELLFAGAAFIGTAIEVRREYVGHRPMPGRVDTRAPMPPTQRPEERHPDIH